MDPAISQGRSSRSSPWGRSRQGAGARGRRSISIAMVIVDLVWRPRRALPSNNRVGSVVVLENDGRQSFSPTSWPRGRPGRGRAGDLDGDGDLDIAVAGFGYDADERAGWRMREDGDSPRTYATAVRRHQHDCGRHQPRRRSRHRHSGKPGVGGGLGVRERRQGPLHPRMLWGSTNPDFGSAGYHRSDLDQTATRDAGTATATPSTTHRRTVGPGTGCSGWRTTATAVRAPSHRRSLWRVEPAGRRRRWRRRCGRGGGETYNNWDDPPRKPGLAGEQRPQQFTMH